MLETFRKRTNNLAFTFLILLIVAVMAMFGIDMGTRQQGGGGPAAYVNGEVISTNEFQQELRALLQQYQQVLGAQYDEKLVFQLGLPKQTLRRLIQYELMSQTADRMGILVPDNELADHIRKMPYFQTNGKFDASLYQRMPNKGYEEKRQRERLQVIKLQEYMQNRVRLTPADVRVGFALSETKMDLAFAAVDFDKLVESYRPTAAAIDKVLASTPEEELKSRYAARQADFTEPARAKIRQIRVGVPYGAEQAKRQEARAKIDAIRAELTVDNFAEVARTKSDDEYAKRGGDRGWVTKGALGATFESAVESLNPGQLSGVIEGEAGYFIIHVQEKAPEKTRPFEQVKRDIAADLAKENHRKEYKEKHLASWNATLASGGRLDETLKSAGVKMDETGSFPLHQGYLPKIGEADSVLTAAFDLNRPNQVAPKLIEHGNKFYYLRLKSVQRADMKGFAQKASEVDSLLVAGLQNEVLNRWMEDIQKSADIEEVYNFDELTPKL